MSKNSMVETMVLHQLSINKDDQKKSTSVGEAFARVCADALYRKDGIEHRVFSDGKNDKGIDFYKFYEDGRIVIAQCKYDDDTDLHRVQSEADKVEDFLKEVSDIDMSDADLDPHKALNMPTSHDELFNALIKLFATNTYEDVKQKISYVFFMASSASDARINNAKMKVKEKYGFGEVYVYTGEDIAYMSDCAPANEKGIPLMIPGITTDEMEGGLKANAKLDAVNKALKEKCAEKNENFEPLVMFSSMIWPTVLGKIVGEEFAQKHGFSRLLCTNVRDILTNKGLRNSIIETILNEPQFFPCYNNGLTIVCSEIRKIQNGGTDEIGLVNASIVNGGQTTNTLYDCYKSSKTKSNLSMAPIRCDVIVMQDKEIRKKISIFRNTQQKVELDSRLSLSDSTITLARHLEYENFHLGVRRGTTGKKGEVKQKKGDLRAYGNIKKVAQSFAAFAVHQPYIGRNCAASILLSQSWLKNIFSGDYTKDNTTASYIASIGILDNCLDELSKKYKTDHPGTQTAGLRYLALYVLGIADDMLCRANSSEENRDRTFAELGFNIPRPLKWGEFNGKYSEKELDVILSTSTSPKHRMSISSMADGATEVLSKLTNKQPEFAVDVDKNGKPIETDFIDWLYETAEKKSAFYGCSVVDGIKNNGTVQSAVAREFCDLLSSSSYKTCKNKFPFLGLLGPSDK